jgi:hypothetical protein
MRKTERLEAHDDIHAVVIVVDSQLENRLLRPIGAPDDPRND